MKMRVSPFPACNSPALRRTFQRAQTGRPHRDHPPACAARLGYGIHGSLRNVIAFAVHGVLVDMFGAHRLKSARADMQRHIGDLHPLVAQGLQHRFIEMQPRRGRRHRACFARKHGLIALLVFVIRRMGDVGRQGQMAIAFQQFQHDSSPAKRRRKNSPSRPSTSTCNASSSSKRLPALGAWLARTCASTSCSFSTRSTSTSTLPPLSLLPNRRALMTRVSFSTSTSSCRTSSQQSAKRRSSSTPPMRMQQTAGAALLGRMLRDQPLGQGKIEFVGTHERQQNVQKRDCS